MQLVGLLRADRKLERSGFQGTSLKEDDNKVAGKQSGFASPMSSKKMAENCKGLVPLNTKKPRTCVLRSFEQWREVRNKKYSEKCPAQLQQVRNSVCFNLLLSGLNCCNSAVKLLVLKFKICAMHPVPKLKWRHT